MLNKGKLRHRSFQQAEEEMVISYLSDFIPRRLKAGDWCDLKNINSIHVCNSLLKIFLTTSPQLLTP